MYHIIVTDLETNKVQLDEDTDCIVGAIHQHKSDVNEKAAIIQLVATACPPITIARVIISNMQSHDILLGTDSIKFAHFMEFMLPKFTADMTKEEPKEEE